MTSVTSTPSLTHQETPPQAPTASKGTVQAKSEAALRAQQHRKTFQDLRDKWENCGKDAIVEDLKQFIVKSAFTIPEWLWKGSDDMNLEQWTVAFNSLLEENQRNKHLENNFFLAGLAKVHEAVKLDGLCTTRQETYDFFKEKFSKHSSFTRRVGSFKHFTKRLKIAQLFLKIPALVMVNQPQNFFLTCQTVLREKLVEVGLEVFGLKEL